MSDSHVKETTAAGNSALPAYEKPRITVMQEEEVLSSFQVTHAAITWWVM